MQKTLALLKKNNSDIWDKYDPSVDAVDFNNSKDNGWNEYEQGRILARKAVLRVAKFLDQRASEIIEDHCNGKTIDRHMLREFNRIATLFNNLAVKEVTAKSNKSDINISLIKILTGSPKNE